jgi:hypothetical protein
VRGRSKAWSSSIPARVGAALAENAGIADGAPFAGLRAFVAAAAIGSAAGRS